MSASGLGQSPLRESFTARFGHIRFDKMKIGMMQKRDKRLAAEQQIVQHGDAPVAAQQLRGQEGTDVARSARDDRVTRLCHALSPSRKVIFQPLISSAGADSSVVTETPCSRQVRRAMSATSPSPRMRTAVVSCAADGGHVILHTLTGFAIQGKGGLHVIDGQAGAQGNAFGRDDVTQFLALGAPETLT